MSQNVKSGLFFWKTTQGVDLEKVKLRPCPHRKQICVRKDLLLFLFVVHTEPVFWVPENYLFFFFNWVPEWIHLKPLSLCFKHICFFPKTNISLHRILILFLLCSCDSTTSGLASMLQHFSIFVWAQVSWNYFFFYRKKKWSAQFLCGHGLFAMTD